MSKRILFILSLSLLIAIIHCAGNCTDKYPYNFDNPNDVDNNGFTDGDTRMVWNHEHSCNTLAAETSDDDNLPYCCYIHIEYESPITNERHDKYGCINVKNPFEDYNGTIDHVKERVNDVEDQLKNELTVQGGTKFEVKDHLHVKIICGAYFSKISLFGLLILILF